MLELIVLGNVPGVHFQITIAWVAFFAVCLLVAAERKHLRIKTVKA